MTNRTQWECKVVKWTDRYGSTYMDMLLRNRFALFNVVHNKEDNFYYYYFRRPLIQEDEPNNT